MPQFDFYIFTDLTVIFAALACFSVFIFFYAAAMKGGVAAQSYILFRASLCGRLLGFGPLLSYCGPLLISEDLLEQFILPGQAGMISYAAVGFLFFSIVVAASAHKAAAFVGSIGTDVYGEGGAVFSRS
jgi:hypothetical protein